MKKVLSGLAVVAAFSFAGSIAFSQDADNGERTYKAKCAACHGASAEGKPAMKAPAITDSSGTHFS